MRLALPKRGEKCVEMMTDVKFENEIDCHVKFRPGIEKNDEKLLEATKDPRDEFHFFEVPGEAHLKFEKIPEH